MSDMTTGEHMAWTRKEGKRQAKEMPSCGSCGGRPRLGHRTYEGDCNGMCTFHNYYASCKKCGLRTANYRTMTGARKHWERIWPEQEQAEGGKS